MTEREAQILNGWPVLTAEDTALLNDQFTHYIFFDKQANAGFPDRGTEFFCSCCGERFVLCEPRRTEEPWEARLLLTCSHNARNTCPKCGRSVTMKDLGRCRERKSLRSSRLVLLLRVGEDSALYADALCLRKDYTRREDLTAVPMSWTCSGYRFAPGEAMQVDYQTWDGRGAVSWEREKLGRKKLVDEPFKVGNLGGYRHEPYHILNPEAVETHPAFRYCQYFQNWHPAGPMSGDFVSYLTAYCVYPRQVEMLVKCGYIEPVEALLRCRKKFAAVFTWEETDPRKAFGLDKKSLNYLLREKPPMAALEVRNHVSRHWGRTWGLAYSWDFCRIWEDGRLNAMRVLRFLREYRIDPDRFMGYADDIQQEHSDLFYPVVFELYRDYINAAYRLGWCLEHSAVLWPDDLSEAHDRAMEALDQMILNKAEQAEGSRAANLNARKQKYEFEWDGLRIVFPASAAAIRHEGKALCHCVGGYAERHLKDVLTILFLRKASAPHRPYVTIEMRGNELVQIHGYHNDIGNPSPAVTHKEFLQTWLRWLKDGSKRDKAGNPKLPRRKVRLTA